MVSKNLDYVVRSLRQKNLRRAKAKSDIRYWKEHDRLGSERVDAGVILLPTRGCRWGRASGCTMCGYVYEAGNMSDQELSKKLQKAVSDLGKITYLKVFTSGSFLDEKEVSEGLLNSIIQTVNNSGVEMLQIESRPEFIVKQRLDLLKEKMRPSLEIGIGLETSNDLIRSECINKGFSYKDYLGALKNCRSSKVFVKTYLLLKPPFILEREAVEDTIKSAQDAEKAGSQKVSVNPMNIQRGTLVELLWKRGEYRTPWLWSLVEVLKNIGDKKLSAQVISHPTGGGKKRGAHNCGECDHKILEAIRKFSLTGDSKVLNDIECSCKDFWKDQLYLE